RIATRVSREEIVAFLVVAKMISDRVVEAFDSRVPDPPAESEPPEASKGPLSSEDWRDIANGREAPGVLEGLTAEDAAHASPKPMWRVGRHIPRNLYRDDVDVGRVDSADIGC